MPLTRFSLRNPIAVTLFYALVVLIGLVALLRMGRSILPPVALPNVRVAALYPGAGAAEIERLVIEPIEDQLRDLPNVARVSAWGQNGIAQVSVQFRFGSNIDADRANVQQAVDAARADLPPDLVPPVVSNDDPAQAPVLEEAVSSALISPAALAQMIERQIVPALRAAPGVGTVQTSGSLVRQFTIRPRIAALDALGATPLDVFRAVSAANELLPGGVLRSPIRESVIGVDASVNSAAEIAALPVTVPGGPAIRVGDLADVTDGWADRSVITRVDGNEAVLLYLSAARGADARTAISGARATFARLVQRLPAIRFQELRTDEVTTNAAIAGVLQTLGEGIVLTVLVMLFFLHAWRSAVVAAIAIPSSLCAAFIAMWIFGFTLNVLSLMGLSLTIGILVDDSIVIIEAIARACGAGLKGDSAALAGRKELGGAAFAITLVDVAVFTPIGLMSGVVGEFMREFALVIVFATAFSLLVSLTLTPLLTAHWALGNRAGSLNDMRFQQVCEALRARARTFPWTMRGPAVLAVLAAWHGAINAFNAFEHRLADAYASHWVPAAMRRRRAVLIGAAALCAVSLIPLFAGMIPSEFAPPVNRGEVTFDVTLPAGTPLTVTDTAVQRLADAMLDDAAVAHVETSAGRAFNGSTDVFASNVAQLSIVAADQNATTSEIERRARSLSPLIPGAEIAGAGKGMGGKPAIDYTIGGDPSVIDTAAARIAAVLRRNPYAADVRISDLGAQPRVTIVPDAAKLQILNVSPGDAAETARIASGGSIATKARLQTGLVNVVVRADAGELGDLEALNRFSVRSAAGARIPLADVMRMRAGSEPAIIERENGERIVSVSANARNDAPISLLTSSLQGAVRDPNFLPAGARIEPRGDIEQFLDTVSRILAALGLSVVAVYVILAVLYRSYTLPLLVMLTVPLASIGAFGSLFVLQVPLNLYSMLGIVMLVGLVAKNGILLVEYAERAVREGMSVIDAISMAARVRFRPILMTTLAMIAGMLPLALGHTIGAEYRKALGIVVIGGLSTSLFLTLFVLPLVYAAYRGRGVKRSRRIVAADEPVYSVQ